MEFQPFEPGIEVHGPSIDAILAGFTLFPTIALEKLASRGIGEIRDVDGRADIVIDRNRWYSQAAWLQAFQDIATTVGSQVMYKIGSQVPQHVSLPAALTDIYTGMAGIDVAYHMNHRKAGRAMFDPETGSMLEGIGHYRAVREAEPRRILMHCKNPYPCDFDRGLLQAMALRFEPGVEVAHARGMCRKKGQDVCSYVIGW